MRWKNIEISSFSIYNACGYTSSASQARHLLLKEKAMRCSANKGIQFIVLFQLLIHRSAVPLLSQEKAKLCHYFGC